MRRKLLGIFTVALMGVIFAAPAMGTQPGGGTCDTYYNHSGFIPGSYAYANFYESGFEPLTRETHGNDINVPPPTGRQSWDKVEKCGTSTTTTSTTVPDEDTSTTDPAQESTTTVGETTTTTMVETTTTVADTTSTSTPSTTVTSEASSTSSPTTVATTTPTTVATTSSTSEAPPTTDVCEGDNDVPCLPETGFDDTTGSAADWGGVAASVIILGGLAMLLARARIFDH